jgi:probable F420-dependent oxidoreductase
MAGLDAGRSGRDQRDVARARCYRRAVPTDSAPLPAVSPATAGSPAPAVPPRWGLTLPLEKIPLHRQRPLVEAVEELGFTDAWSSEVASADAFTPLALMSVWAPTLRLGTAIVPVQTRGAALLAMSAAALADAAPGRFALGIGASSPAVVGAWNGLPYVEPFRRVRDTLRFLRRALAGEKIDEHYDTFTVRGFRLGLVPEVAPPILLAALRPGMLRLAGREADGVILNWLAPSDVPQAVAALGPEGAGKEVVARIFVCPTEDKVHARALGRRMITSYLTVPVYAEFHRWLGRGEVLAPMWKAWEGGDRAGANDAIPDDVVDALIVHGSPESCRGQLRAYATAGITTPVAALLPTPDFASPAGLLAAIQAIAPHH